MKYKYLYLILIGCILLQSCGNSDINTALEFAGENRAELEKVLTHYSQNSVDSLKLRAAEFLIANMVYHYSIESAEMLEYYAAIAEVNNRYWWHKDTNTHRAKYDSINALYPDLLKNASVKHDIQHVAGEYLIKTIDSAYDSWKNGNFARHVSFDDFCDYLLPYRIDHEPLENWRDTLRTTYHGRIDWIQTRDSWRNSAFQAAYFMNDQIKTKGFYMGDIYSYQLDYPPSVLNNLKTGKCEHFAVATAFIMRSCGIPVAVDHVTQWPHRNQNHTWNAVLNNAGKWIQFMGGERNPGQSLHNSGGTATESLYGKVWRKTFSYQTTSLFAANQKYGEDIPRNIASPFMKDVSEQYFDPQDITIDISEKPKQKTHFVYLAVFNNQEWIPIHWTYRNGSKATFSNMEHGIVYLPVFYSKEGIHPAGCPFLFTLDNRIHYLKPDFENVQTVELMRKYPRFSGVLGYSDRMTNGVFEAADNADFKNAVVATQIKTAPYMRFDSVQIDSGFTTPYRFWRFLAADNKHCNVAEMEFYDTARKLLNGAGKIIAAEPSHLGCGPEKAFDNVGVTYYESKASGGGWVGMDFEKPVQMGNIRYLPRNDDNNVWRGDTYELVYWNNNDWQSLGKLTATTEKLTFHNIPKNSLLLLHNHSRGKEERIFTCENGEQMWW
jgi:hypothetical protein